VGDVEPDLSRVACALSGFGLSFLLLFFFLSFLLFSFSCLVFRFAGFCCGKKKKKKRKKKKKCFALWKGREEKKETKGMEAFPCRDRISRNSPSRKKTLNFIRPPDNTARQPGRVGENHRNTTFQYHLARLNLARRNALSSSRKKTINLGRQAADPISPLPPPSIPIS
jgi:hypothetical protein